MSPKPARDRLAAAGLRAGSAIIGHAPRLLESVRATIAVEEIEQVDLLLRVMAGFDNDEAEHLEAVGTLAMLLADHYGLTTEQVASSLLAGRVHDIGKLAISRTVLFKPGSPSRNEWAELKLHPVYGGSTLAGLPRLKRLAPIIIAHHERADGLGYPYGLAGSEIPIESQIVAIAEAFCAMTVPRPYCPTRLPNEAIEELQRCAGAQFSAELVEAFADMFRQRPDVPQGDEP
jgi:HD-GYP domain-containing protein (c-di-GMP phosphodiesterase class II)